MCTTARNSLIFFVYFLHIFKLMDILDPFVVLGSGVYAVITWALFPGWLICLSISTRWFDIWISGSKWYKYAALHNLFCLSGREVRKVQVIYSGGHLAGDILRWPKHPVTCALTQPPCKDYAIAENSQSCQRYFPDLTRLANIPQKPKILLFLVNPLKIISTSKKKLLAPDLGKDRDTSTRKFSANDIQYGRKEVEVQML